MIRPITPNDSAAVIALAVDSGLFPADQTEVLDALLANTFGDDPDEGHIVVMDEGDGLLGVAYYEPAPATDRTWYLTMIGIRRAEQGKGRGSVLMQYVEDALRADGQRLLLVETSGVPEFELTRQFYLKCGYEQAARVRDYWADGEDMVLFRKAL